MAPRNSKPRVLFLDPATKYDLITFNRTKKQKKEKWPRGDLNSGPFDYQSNAPPDYATGPMNYRLDEQREETYFDVN